MSTPLSELITREIHLPGGVKVTPLEVRIDSQNGSICGVITPEGFLGSDHLVQKNEIWQFTGKLTGKKRGENWINFKVQNRQKKYRGRITELWIDPLSFMITRIECSRTFLGRCIQRRIYSADDIFEVIPAKKLVVVEEENRVFQPQKVFRPAMT